MEWSEYEKNINEIRQCMIYEQGQTTDECCGASGRKFRQVCVYCPNHERWIRRKEKEKEGKNNEKNH